MTTAVTIAPVARQLFLNPSNGAPASGFKLFTYAAGTTTKLATYLDSTGATPNTNPIIMDSLGECDLWFQVNTAYKLVFAAATDTDPPTNPIWSRDNISNSAILTVSGTFNFATTAQLLAAFGSGVIVADGSAAITAGRTSENDHGGGTFYYNATDTTSSDNGGTIRVDGQGRRWYAICANGVSVLLFGADPSGSADSSTPFQNAINVVKANVAYPNYSVVGNSRPAGFVYVPAGKYLITKSLNFTTAGSIYGIGIVGDGTLQTYIEGELTETYAVIDASGMAYFFARNFQVRCSTSSQATCAMLLANPSNNTFNNRNSVLENLALATDTTQTSTFAIAGLVVQDADLLKTRNVTAQGPKGIICGASLPSGITSKFQTIPATGDQTSYWFKQSTFIGPQPFEFRGGAGFSLDDVYIQGGDGGSSGSLDADKTAILVSYTGQNFPLNIYCRNVRTENQTSGAEFYAFTFDTEIDLLDVSGDLDIVPNTAVDPTGAVIRGRGAHYSIGNLNLHGFSTSFLGTPPVLFDIPVVGGNANSGTIRSLTGQFRADGGPGTLGTSISKFAFDWGNQSLDGAWATFLNTYLLPSNSIPTFSTRAVSRYNAVETILTYTPAASAPVVRYSIEAGLLKTQVRQKLNVDLSMFSLQAVEFSLYIVQTATGISQQMGDVPAASATAGYSAQIHLLINERGPGSWEAGASIIYGHNAGGGVSAFSSAVTTLTGFDPTQAFTIEVWGASASANPIAPFAVLIEVS